MAGLAQLPLQPAGRALHRSRQPNVASAGLPLELELEVAAGGVRSAPLPPQPQAERIRRRRLQPEPGSPQVGATSAPPGAGGEEASASRRLGQPLQAEHSCCHRLAAKLPLEPELQGAAGGVAARRAQLPPQPQGAWKPAGGCRAHHRCRTGGGGAIRRLGQPLQAEHHSCCHRSRKPNTAVATRPTRVRYRASIEPSSWKCTPQVAGCACMPPKKMSHPSRADAGWHLTHSRCLCLL